jgi:outer membrane protein assembly factor BamB
MKIVMYYVAVLVLTCSAVNAADWPQFKYDGSRSAASPQKLADTLHLYWQRQLPEPKRAWQDKSNSAQLFDACYQPVIGGKLIFVPSMNNDTVTAYSTETGELVWRIFADGPVRMAPIYYKGTVLFASDDGYLYSVEAKTGKLRWKFKGSPKKRRILGNERLISSWPVRGGAVLHDDTVYFACSIWPFMGVFYHAVNAETGELVWTNSGSGQVWCTQPHGAGSFAGIAPQGYITATKTSLIVTGGRTAPAVYDRLTGKLKNYSNIVSSAPRWWAQGIGEYGILPSTGEMFNLQTGRNSPIRPKAVLLGDKFYQGAADILTVYDTTPKMVETVDRRGKKGTRLELVKLYEVKQPMAKKILLKSGDKIFGAGRDGIQSVKLVDKKAEGVWTQAVNGTVVELMSADDKLFAVTQSGALLCFGPDKRTPKEYKLAAVPLVSKDDPWVAKAKKVIGLLPDKGGYCVSLGLGSGRLIEELLLQSKLNIIAVEADAKKAEQFRRKMLSHGLYGKRVCVVVDDPHNAALPPYIASLIVSETAQSFDSTGLKHIYSALRPYGGKAVLPSGSSGVTGKGLVNAKLTTAGDTLTLSREGSLPGSSDWTHQYGDEANRVSSYETNVLAPMGMLWFGGPTNDDVLPRHGHGPSPQVAGGYYYIEGENMIRCCDIYTGRLIWQRDLKDIGYYYRHTGHHPGAGDIGSNYVSLPDGIYIMSPEKCYILHPTTGETMKEISMPSFEGYEKSNWGVIRVHGDYLVATAVPVSIVKLRWDKPKKGEKLKPRATAIEDFEKVSTVKVNDSYGTGSKFIVVMNRRTGKVLWYRKAVMHFRHNAIALGNNRVFCLDAFSQKQKDTLKQAGYAGSAFDKGQFLALDIQTGKEVWGNKDAFGTWLGYHKERDLLLQTDSRARDRAWDEGTPNDRGAVVYDAATGKEKWAKKIVSGGPAMLIGDEIISSSGAYDVVTGKAKSWRYNRQYGCNTIIGCPTMLTFRSGAAGYYDLSNKSGTGNFGGFKSGCTNNMMPAGGLLVIPDYTRTCSCAYNNQSSLALTHMSDLDSWTYNGTAARNREGYNFSAPGDRKSESGTLFWSAISGKEIKRSKGYTPKAIELTGGAQFSHHSLYFTGSDSWIGANGLEGVTELTIKPSIVKGNATLRLYFAEPVQNAAPGTRIFSVSVQGKIVIKDLDITKEAGASRKTLIKEFRNIAVNGPLKLKFTASKGLPVICGVELIAVK